jgi:hypothetical protein
MRIFEFRIRGLIQEQIQPREQQPERPSRGREVSSTLVVLAALFYLGAQLRPALALTPLPEFAAQPVGSSSPMATLLLANTGSAPLTIESAHFDGEQRNDFHLEAAACVSHTLAPRQSCILGVSFQPSGEGMRTTRLVITDNTSASPHVLLLSGTAVQVRVPTPVAVLYPPGYDFREVEVRNPIELPFRVANEGDGPLHVVSVVLSDDAGGVWKTESVDCENDVAPNDSCHILVTFAPAATQDYATELSITHNAGGALRIPLAGRGLPEHGYCCSDGEIETLDANACAGRGGIFSTDILALRQRCMPRDGQPPTIPVGLRPGSPEETQPADIWPCTAVQLDWEPVTDPSSPVTYHVKLQRLDMRLGRTGADPWKDLRDDPDVHTSPLDVTAWVNPAAQTPRVTKEDRRALRMVRPSGPTRFRWRISARDAAGNESEPSGWYYFVCQQPPPG